MPGPAPKPPEERRRRNAPASGEWITLPAEPYEGPRPKLPSRMNGRKPSAATAATWESWWADPAAHMWTPSDHQALLRLIRLVEDYHVTAKLDVLREIRLQLAMFGLTPAGRQQRHWNLPSTAGHQSEAPTPPKRSSSRRRFQVVDGG